MFFSDSKKFREMDAKTILETCYGYWPETTNLLAGIISSHAQMSEVVYTFVWSDTGRKRRKGAKRLSFRDTDFFVARPIRMVASVADRLSFCSA